MTALLPIRATLALGVAITFSIPATAQGVTTHSVDIGGNNTFSCSGTTNPATLSDGVTEASARIDFSYDSSQGILDLTVVNTSPVVPNVPNPVIDAVAINFPETAVTGAQLVQQRGGSGATPSFAFSVDNDPSQRALIGFNCFGNVFALLDARGTVGGIANEAAQTFAGARGSLTLGDTTFRMQLTGPGTRFITARTIALQFSRNQAQLVNVSASFRDGGASGAAGGEISSPHDACFPTLWIDAPPKIGTTIGLFASATSECETCVLVSWNPGPSQLSGIDIPIGLPAQFVFQVPRHPEVPVDVRIPIPNNTSLLEGPIYLAIAAVSPTAGLEFSEQFTMTFEN